LPPLLLSPPSSSPPQAASTTSSAAIASPVARRAVRRGRTGPLGASKRPPVAGRSSVPCEHRTIDRSLPLHQPFVSYTKQRSSWVNPTATDASLQPTVRLSVRAESAAPPGRGRRAIGRVDDEQAPAASSDVAGRPEAPQDSDSSSSPSASVSCMLAE
jgi:hypothetical protein